VRVGHLVQRPESDLKPGRRIAEDFGFAPAASVLLLEAVCAQPVIARTKLLRSGFRPAL
jgi:hypothetical protein